MDSSTSRSDYERRIHRVMDYINRHLDEEIRLEELANEAAFSPFHFHRVFTAMMGEPVAAYIRRVRLERAASDLVYYPQRSITEIAQRSGFSSSAVFARAFRDRFGTSASEWRKNRKTLRKESEESAAGPRYALPCWVSEGTAAERKQNVEVIIEDMPAIRAAYVRKMGAYRISATEAWSAMCRWAGPRGLLSPGHMLFSVSHDDPDVTAPEKLRYDACVSIDAATKLDDQVGLLELPARRVAKARYDGPAMGIINAYRAFYGEWLPESGFVPGDTPPIEVYYPEQGNDPEHDRFVMDICVPVVPA